MREHDPQPLHALEELWLSDEPPGPGARVEQEDVRPGADIDARRLADVGG